MSHDPRILQIAQALHARVPTTVERLPEDREAAVALVVRAREDLELLMIKRAERERDPWSGHVALPGGRRSAIDPDLAATAVRETFEETGIALSDAQLLGALDEVHPRSTRLPPLLVAPFVYATDADAVATPDPREVDVAIWVPFSALCDPAAISELILELGGGARRRFPSIVYQEYTIWGMTHRILTNFFELFQSPVSGR